MKIKYKNEVQEHRFVGTVKELLTRLDLNPVTVLVVRAGTLLTLDRKLADSDIIEIHSVVSGG